MKLLLLSTLVLFSACSSNSVKINNNALHFVKLKENVESSALLSKMTDEEKQTLLNGYLSFYKFAMRRNCGFSEVVESGPGLRRLGIPPLTYRQINRRDIQSPQNTASYLDLSTDLDTQTYYFLGQESDRANEVFFNDTPPPPVISEKGFRLILLRSGKGVENKFTVCAIHGQKKNLCVDDNLTSKMVDIHDDKKFCEWLNQPLVLKGSQKEETLNYLVQVLKTIEVL